MIIAPDVFAIEQGAYTPEITVDWFKDPRLGIPMPLFVGRTLRYSAENGWEVAGASAATAWKRLSQAPKTVKAAFDQVDTSGDYYTVEGYYELIGPKLTGNPHGLDEVTLVRHGAGAFAPGITDVPRTSLYAWPAWLAQAGAPGVLWVDDSTGERRYAAVRREYMPEV